MPSYRATAARAVLAGLLVEVARHVLGPREVLAGFLDAVSRVLDVRRVRIEIQEALVLLERVQGLGLIAIGAALLPEVALRHLELRVIALGMGRVEGQELSIGADGQDVVRGPAFLK